MYLNSCMVWDSITESCIIWWYCAVRCMMHRPGEHQAIFWYNLHTSIPPCTLRCCFEFPNMDRFGTHLALWCFQLFEIPNVKVYRPGLSQQSEAWWMVDGMWWDRLFERPLFWWRCNLVVLVTSWLLPMLPDVFFKHPGILQVLPRRLCRPRPAPDCEDYSWQLILMISYPSISIHILGTILSG